MNKHALGILVLAIIMISLPLHLRFSQDNNTLAGTEPYYHERMAKSLSNGIPTTDDAIVNGRPYILHPYHFLLTATYNIAGQAAFILVPALLAFASTIFLWLLLRKLQITKHIQPWILLVYALSPPLIATGTLGTPYAFILTLLLAGSWLMFTTWWILGVAFFIIAAYSGMIYTIAAILTLTILIILKPKNKHTTITLFPVSILLLLDYYPLNVPQQTGLLQYLSDIGGTYGLSIFALLLAIVGATTLWSHKKAYYSVFAIIILIFLISFFLPELLILANVLVSIVGGVALSKLATRKWELKFLREATLLVLFCGLLFSGIAHAVTIASAQPDSTFFDSISNIKAGTILSHQDYGFWIEYAGHKAVTDTLWKYLPEAEEQHGDAAILLASTDVTEINQLLDKYNITYILVTSEMKHGLTWEREEQGLEFIVENSESFKRIETQSSIGLWQRK